MCRRCILCKYRSVGSLLPDRSPEDQGVPLVALW